MKKKRLSQIFLLFAVLMMFSSAYGAAGINNVRCVLWQGDVTKHHTAISGKAVKLAGVINTSGTGAIWYKWVFGDGAESAKFPLSGKTQYSVEISTHVYTGYVGTPFTAQLWVDGTDAGSFAPATAIDNYLVKIEEDNLDANVNIVIAEGLWYLYTHQLVDAGIQSKAIPAEPVTAWTSYSNFYPSATGAALQAFQINNHKETGNYNEDPYAEVVNAGLNWLLNGRYGNNDVLAAINIVAQIKGDPDSNGNERGIQVNYPYYPPYQGGLVMDAIISTGTPNADSRRDFDGDGQTDSYQKVIQDMVDAYAWGQSDGNGLATGWAYNWNSGNTDNSTNQWAAIGLIPAQDHFGCTIPAFVKSQLNLSLTSTYDAGGKYFGYTSTSPLWGQPYVTRPSGMVQMILANPNTYETDSRWTGPLSWYSDTFFTGVLQIRTYYGWLSFVKSMILSGTETLTPSNPQNPPFSWYRGVGNVGGLAQKLISDHESDGSWPAGGQGNPHPDNIGDVFATSWAIQMLKPALFNAAPIACFTATPNQAYSAAIISFDPSCSSHSETGKDIKNIEKFEWDFDNDGVYAPADTTNSPSIKIVNDPNDNDPNDDKFICLNPPCKFPVTLRVTDDEGFTATYSLDINVTDPPHPPVSNAGGPYMVSTCPTDSLQLDGRKSFDPDQGKFQTGCSDCDGDTIMAWDWDLKAPYFPTPPVNPDKSGPIVTVTAADLLSYFNIGKNTVGLRVTDNTPEAFPASGDPALTNVNFSTVDVYDACACNLAARAKAGKIQLTWTHPVGSAETYDVYKSEVGPNTGFINIKSGLVTTYATYLDTDVTIGKAYWYRIMSSKGCGSKSVKITSTTR